MSKAAVITAVLSTTSLLVQAIDGVTSGTTAEGQKDTGTILDINDHKQNEAFEDKDHDMIEDLSVDKELEAAEKKEAKEEAKDVKPSKNNGALEGAGPSLDQLMGSFGGGMNAGPFG